MRQSFNLKAQFYDITIYFDTEQTMMGEALKIEGERVLKCMQNRQSFMESKWRLIHDGKSKPCTQSGSLIE